MVNVGALEDTGYLDSTLDGAEIGGVILGALDDVGYLDLIVGVLEIDGVLFGALDDIGRFEIGVFMFGYVTGGPLGAPHVGMPVGAGVGSSVYVGYVTGGRLGAPHVGMPVGAGVGSSVYEYGRRVV